MGAVIAKLENREKAEKVEKLKAAEKAAEKAIKKAAEKADHLSTQAVGPLLNMGHSGITQTAQGATVLTYIDDEVELPRENREKPSAGNSPDEASEEKTSAKANAKAAQVAKGHKTEARPASCGGTTTLARSKWARKSEELPLVGIPPTLARSKWARKSEELPLVVLIAVRDLRRALVLVKTELELVQFLHTKALRCDCLKKLDKKLRKVEQEVGKIEVCSRCDEHLPRSQMVFCDRCIDHTPYCSETCRREDAPQHLRYKCPGPSLEH